MPEPAIVQRDQCNGRTMACVNCGMELGGRHDILCYAYAIERTKARRAALSGGSTPIPTEASATNAPYGQVDE